MALRGYHLIFSVKVVTVVMGAFRMIQNGPPVVHLAQDVPPSLTDPILHAQDIFSRSARVAVLPIVIKWIKWIVEWVDTTSK